MGQAETKNNQLQSKLDEQSKLPSTFIEDMTPEEKAKFYKNVLKVKSKGNSASGTCESGKHLLLELLHSNSQPFERVQVSFGQFQSQFELVGQ